MSGLLKQRYDIEWDPENAHIHCLAHTTNLIVQKFLSVLSKAPDPDSNNHYISNKHVPIHYDAAMDEVVKALDNEANDDEDYEDVFGKPNASSKSRFGDYCLLV